jgi:hypothetical protein
MKCIECKWYVGQTNDTYGLCKRYPIAQNKTQTDWCGEFSSKVELEVVFKYDINTDETKPKRGRKPKA